MAEIINRKKSSLNITLVLIATITIVSCGQKGSRPIYQSMKDCTDEWGASDCDAIPSDSSDRHYGGYYGRFHGTGLYSRSSTSRAVGVGSVTRGGFGGSSGFHSSGGRS